MKLRQSVLSFTSGLAFILLAGSCFTGVESTPRITAPADKGTADTRTAPEETVIAGLRPQPPRSWARGKEFMIADGRIGRIFSPAENDSANLPGTILRYMGADTAVTLTGDRSIALVFSDGTRRHIYRLPDTESARYDTLDALGIPFTIDIDMVSAADSLLRGRRLYVRTPRWNTPARPFVPLKGLRHVEVTVDSVIPGTAQFPAAVCFTATDGRNTGMLLMSLAKGSADSRRFASLFAIDNLRLKHPEIKDDVWKLITASKVRPGMTTQECRLALGQPDQVLRTPSYGGMREHWRFDDGMYLLFDDGYLVKYTL